MPFDSTLKGESANSYISLEVADNYHEGRLHNPEWSNASRTQKEAALIMATRSLESFRFVGAMSSSVQSLQWPRSGVDLYGNTLNPDAIPIMVSNAVSEFAWDLLKADRTADSDSAGISSVKAGPVEVEFDRMTSISSTPPSVIQYLNRYVLGGIGNVARLERA